MDVDSTLIQDEVIELLAEPTRAGSRRWPRSPNGRCAVSSTSRQSLHERVACLAGTSGDSGGRRPRRRPAHSRGPHPVPHPAPPRLHGRPGQSGGFIEVVGPLAASLGIRHVHVRTGSRPVDGVLTGPGDRRRSSTAPAKAAALRRVRGRGGTAAGAYGGGRRRRQRPGHAGRRRASGIAFNAKPVVRAQADTAVNVPYLDAVLYLLGIPRADVEDADAADAEDLADAVRSGA